MKSIIQWRTWKADGEHMKGVQKAYGDRREADEEHMESTWKGYGKHMERI